MSAGSHDVHPPNLTPPPPLTSSLMMGNWNQIHHFCRCCVHRHLFKQDMKHLFEAPRIWRDVLFMDEDEDECEPKCFLFTEESVQRCKYIRYLNKTKAIVFIILSGVNRVESHLLSNSATVASLFDYVIHSLAARHCCQCRSVD